ncbi:MAG: S-layer homology domain-containing protein [Oscillibacter sp.]|uniref:S-layer homology domain-containing protein n=1 Tax=Oscillibacter sp. TaxID=1945593 RepID=UPI002896E426|nr:S-layer homology domain-containing protein [Oscillibacter sp.]MEA4993557.1 S-layer homology domain-containing protein [Oscillibacter sp.]
MHPAAALIGYDSSVTTTLDFKPQRLLPRSHTVDSYAALSGAGTVTFTTTHFSRYTVGYNKVAFTNVSDSAWYYDAVTYLAAQGVTDGTTDTTFTPGAVLTCGQFITLLLKAYGIKAVDGAEDNFSAAGDT